MDKLYEAMKKFITAGEYRQAYDCLANMYGSAGPTRFIRQAVVSFRKILKNAMLDRTLDTEMLYDILHDSYVLTARDSFDDFMIAIEWYRDDKDKFWLVRRNQLLPVCEALESLLSDDLD